MRAFVYTLMIHLLVDNHGLQNYLSFVQKLHWRTCLLLMDECIYCWLTVFHFRLCICYVISVPFLHWIILLFHLFLVVNGLITFGICTLMPIFLGLHFFFFSICRLAQLEFISFSSTFFPSFPELGVNNYCCHNFLLFSSFSLLHVVLFVLLPNLMEMMHLPILPSSCDHTRINSSFPAVLQAISKGALNRYLIFH